MGQTKWLSSGRVPIPLDLGYANFYEKALFVKPTWRLRVAERNGCFALRAMLLSALSVSHSLCGG
jgi:hypothetical protein